VVREIFISVSSQLGIKHRQAGNDQGERKASLGLKFFFLKRLKWNILPNQNVLPSTRCIKEEYENHYNMYKLKTKAPNTKKKETKLANAQQS